MSNYCKNCYELTEKLEAKEQECEQEKALKETYLTCYKAKHGDVIGKLFKYKQALTEIKEIAEGMHDFWINKTKYTDIDNLVKHILECELNRIRYKLDEISECEGNDE